MIRLMSKTTYFNIVRWWLIFFLFFIPVQIIVSKSIGFWSKALSTYIRRLDEITIFLLFPLAIVAFLKKRELINKYYLVLSVPIILLIMLGFISGITNGNSLYVTSLGIFDYIKYLLLIFIYGAFFRDLNDFKKIFRFLLIVGVFLGIIAFIQEIWALSSVYIIGKDKNDPGIDILTGMVDPNKHELVDLWRLGVYRPPSLINHPNYLGLYSLLIYIMYFINKKKQNLAAISALFSGILLSISRMVYTSFLFVLVYQIIRYKKRILSLLIVPLIIGMFCMSNLPDFNIWMDYLGLRGDTINKSSYEVLNLISFREFSKNKSIEIWKDHPFWGVGPGMFGGAISLLYNSPIYEEYNFHKSSFFKRIKTIDQFWPRVMAEMGINGVLVFIAFFISLFTVLFELRKRTKFGEIRNLYTGLVLFTIVILIYISLGSGLNVTPVITTYAAFVGMGLSISNNLKK
jgi:hypothetical protein